MRWSEIFQNPNKAALKQIGSLQTLENLHKFPQLGWIDKFAFSLESSATFFLLQCQNRTPENKEVQKIKPVMQGACNHYLEKNSPKSSCKGKVLQANGQILLTGPPTSMPTGEGSVKWKYFKVVFWPETHFALSFVMFWFADFSRWLKLACYSHKGHHHVCKRVWRDLPELLTVFINAKFVTKGGGASWGENVWVVLWSEIILHRASLCSDHLIFQDGITQPITHKQHMRLGVPLPKCLGNTWLNFWPSPQGLNFVTWCGDGIGLGSHQQKIVESFLSTWSTLCTGFHCILTILLSRWQKSACNSQTVHIRPVYTCQKCLERPNWTFGCLHNGKVLSHK